MTQLLQASGITQSRFSIAPAQQSKVITATDLDACFKIIGKTSFRLDDVFLNDYLQHVLGWWYGKRLAQGVGIPLGRRCWYAVFLMSWLGLLMKTPSGRVNIIQAVSGGRGTLLRTCISPFRFLSLFTVSCHCHLGMYRRDASVDHQ